MSINLKEATDFMLANGYILLVGKGKYKLSTKFHTEYRFIASGIWEQIPKGVYKHPGPLVHFTFSWENDYKQFILDARVPKRLDNGRGESYQANAYSEAGMKAFRKAIESGVDMDVLKKAVQLYYGGTIRYKQAIGAFMEKGTWKTVYDELLAAANAGEQTLINHIKEETKDDQQSSYRLG